MDHGYVLAMILVMALSNFFTRVFPFLFFVRREPTAWILFLEKWFPPVIMTILVFYSLRQVDFSAPTHGSLELAAVTSTIVLHLVLKNYLVSIFGSTLIYMGLLQGLG